MKYENARSFAWGSAIAVFLGLTTLEVSGLRQTTLENAIDAQQGERDVWRCWSVTGIVCVFRS